MVLGGHELDTSWTATEIPRPSVSPVVVDDDVYVPTHGGIISFDNSDGTKQRVFLENERIHSGPAVDNSLIYVGTKGTDESAVYALDPKGDPAWDLPASASSISAVAAGNGRAYIGVDRRVYGVREGTEEWEFDTRTRDGSDRDVSALEYASGTVFVAVENEAVSALDATDGTRQWQHGVESQTVELTVSNGVVAVGTHDLTVLDAASGEVRWRQELDRELGTRPAVTDDAVYAAGAVRDFEDENESWLAAFDRSDGSELWRWSTHNPVSGMVAAEDTLYVAYWSGTLEVRDTFDGNRRAKEVYPEHGWDLVGYGSHLYLTTHGPAGTADRIIAISTPHEELGDPGTTEPTDGHVVRADSEPTDESVCPSCETSLAGDEAFCPECGHALSN